jgi:hypothetical protein
VSAPRSSESHSESRLRALASLRDDGIITTEQFETARADVLRAFAT